MTLADGRDLLARLGSTARWTGSDAESDCRRLCAEVLRDAGFDVTERPFRYSALPGVWGTTIIGLVLLAGAVTTGSMLAFGGGSMPAIQAAVATVIVAAIPAWWLGRFGTRFLPFMRRSGVNLEATRPVAESDATEQPLVWLVAHLDSKSQPIPLVVRATAIAGSVVLWTALLVSLGLSRESEGWRVMAVLLSLGAGVAAVPLIFSLPADRSAGTLDNASGVASILQAVGLMDRAAPVGVLITSAEELGLAGARAWVQGRQRAVAINCDGVDDVGRLTITASAAALDLLARTAENALSGQNIRFRRRLPGVLLDASAFADRGWVACTVSRGTWRSLMRVHTERDSPAAMTGAGLMAAAELIGALAGAIIAVGRTFEYLKGGTSTTWSSNV